MEANYRWPMLWGLIANILGSGILYFHFYYSGILGVCLVLFASQLVYWFTVRIKQVPFGHSFVGAIALLVFGYLLFALTMMFLFYFAGNHELSFY